MPLQSPTARDGDAGFIGFASRMNPVSLPAGVLQLSENMRLDRGTAKTRKGVRRMADEILLGTSPLTIPFSLTSPGPEIRDSYEGGIFAGASYRSPDQRNGEEYIVLAGASAAYVFEDPAQAYLRDAAGNIILDNNGDPIVSVNTSTTINYPAGESIDATDTVSMVQAFDRLYLLREADEAVQGWERKALTTGGIAVSGTVATVHRTAHGYLAGQRVRIEGSSVAAFAGHEYDIVTATTNSFTITVPAGTASDTSLNGRRVRRVKAPLYWTGDTSAGFIKSTAGIPAGLNASYKTMRSVGFAAYVQNRLWIPDGKDTIAVSDYLDSNTYDPFWQSFRANQGSNDYLVAVHPWREGEVLIFMRHSIWLAQVNQFPSTDGSTFSIDTPITDLVLLTQEVGCAARKSIQTAGNFVYFLSDSGIHRLDTALDLKLQGNTLPLSDPIANLFDDVNGELVHNACSLYFNNRYYISLPINNAFGSGQPADGNNAVLIFSQLNGQWESKDYYGATVDDLIVSAYDAKRRIYAVNRTGKLFLLEDKEAGDDPPSTVGSPAPVQGRLVTRRYGMGTMHTKRFTRVLSDVVLPDTAAITVKARTLNPDTEMTLVPGQDNTSGLAEDYTLKQPIRTRAHYCEIEFLTTANRPEIRTVSVEATMAGLPQTETRHAA